MPSIQVPAAYAALTTTATNKGVVAVASTVPFHTGAEAWVAKDDGSNGQHVIITRIIDGTHLQCRPVPENAQWTVWQLLYTAGGDLSRFGGPISTASKDFGTVGSGAFDSVLAASVVGYRGNAVTVALVGDSPAAGGVTINVVGTAVTIHFEDGVSTVADVEAAITALTGADAVVVVQTPGTGATVLSTLTDQFTATALAGGVASYISMPAQVVRVVKPFTKRPNIG